MVARRHHDLLALLDDHWGRQRVAVRSTDAAAALLEEATGLVDMWTRRADVLQIPFGAGPEGQIGHARVLVHQNRDHLGRATG